MSVTVQVAVGRHYQHDEDGREVEISAQRVLVNGRYEWVPSKPFQAKEDLSKRFPNKFIRPDQLPGQQLPASAEVWDSEKESLDSFVGRMKAKAPTPVTATTPTPAGGNGGDAKGAEIKVEQMDLVQLQRLVEAEELDVAIKGKKLDEARALVRKALG